MAVLVAVGQVMALGLAVSFFLSFHQDTNQKIKLNKNQMFSKLM